MTRKRISTAVNMYLDHLNSRTDIKHKTVEDYRYWANRIKKEFGEYEVDRLKENDVSKVLLDLYNKGNVRTAELLRVAGRRLYAFLHSIGYKFQSPFVKDKIRHQERSYKWTHSEVEQLLHHMYKEFRTTSAGIIVHILYETSFTVTEARELKWENVDLSEPSLPLITVGDKTCMISQDLADVLTQQKARFDFQEYVAPTTNPCNGVYKPIRADSFSTMCRECMDAVGIRPVLRVADLVYNNLDDRDDDANLQKY